MILGFKHRVKTKIIPSLIFLFKLQHQEHQDTLENIGKIRDDINLPTDVLFVIMSFFDMDAECCPYEQTRTPNTLIAYHQHYEPEYRFFFKRNHYSPDKPIYEKVDNIIDFVNSDDPLDESVQHSSLSLTR